MLRVTAIANSDAAKAYFRSADYYLEGHEHPAFWHGKAAELLGLSGPVDYAAFESLCDNLHPLTGDKLTKAKGVRRVGFDFTFSVPKSVSLLYSLGQDERVADAFRAAVADTMADVEKEMATRVRRAGMDTDRTTGNMVWTDFLHTTSRPIKGQPDPQLHIHAVAFNLTWDERERQWKAGQFGDLKANAPFYQAAFRARLANRLQDLGYSLRRTKDDFEITGVPERAVKEFSRRTAQIEKLAEQLGIVRPESKAKLGATSRDKKVKGLTWAELLALWKDRITADELAAINDTSMAAVSPTKREDKSRDAVDWALAHLLERRAVVPERMLETEALKYGLGAVTPEAVRGQIESHEELIRKAVDGEMVVSTKGVLAEELAIIRFAEDGRGRFRPLSPPVATQALSRVEPNQADTLSPSQQAAFRHILTSHDQLMVVRGVAGAGKSTLLKSVLPHVGVPLEILAPSASASRGVLREEGFTKADTLASFLLSKDRQKAVRHGLIVLDEAGMVGSRDMNRLLQLADSLHARVLLLGDRRQHKSVARGDVLTMIEDRAGLPVVEVAEIKRQAGAYKQAVEKLAKGEVYAGFVQLDELGWVKEADHEQLATDYLTAVRGGKSVLVVSPTHAEGEQVTAAIREKLREDGRLKGEDRVFERLVPLHLTEAEKCSTEHIPVGAVAVFHRNRGRFRASDRFAVSTDRDVVELSAVAGALSVFEPAAIHLATGDQIRLTANGKTLDGHRLNNGATYTVSGFDSKGNIQLNNGWLMSKEFGHFDHGYAVTSHAAQGRTVDQVLIAQSSQSFPASGAEQFYVSASRGRQQAIVYTDDKLVLRDAIQRQDKRLLATDLVKPKRTKLKQRLRRHLSSLYRRWREPEINYTGREHEREMVGR